MEKERNRKITEREISQAIAILEIIKKSLGGEKLKSWDKIHNITKEVRFLANDLVFLGEIERSEFEHI